MVFSVRQKGVPPLLLPASVLQLPRCLVRICNLFHKNHRIANLTVLKNAIAAGKTDCKIQFASQTWATRPHLGSIFEKLLHRKTFICLRLVSCSLPKNPLLSAIHILAIDFLQNISYNVESVFSSQLLLSRNQEGGTTHEQRNISQKHQANSHS